MGTCIAAHTNLDQTYPGFINFTRNDNGTVTAIVRGDPKNDEGCYVCVPSVFRGQPGRCTPGDDRCNNYCNLAPEKGPMQKAPADCTHIREGATVSLKLSAAAFEALIAASR